MNCKDIELDLDDYVDDTLTEGKRTLVDAHLLTCESCRTEVAKLHALLMETRRLPKVISPPDALWANVRKGITAPATIYRLPDVPSRNPERPSPWLWAMAAAIVLMIYGIWMLQPENGEGWVVARINGTPRIGTEVIDSSAKLAKGRWLETDVDSRARLIVGMIGEVEIEPNSRLRVLETKVTDHRIELSRGTMHATIWAPPRIFFVETPSATAVDLGCEYTLTVAENGAGLLHVTFGYVLLQRGDRESVVPAGVMCMTYPDKGPGTPFAEDASNGFRAALEIFDHEGRTDAVSTLVQLARKQDAVTLFHIIPRTSGKILESVVDRLAALTGFPAGVTRAGILHGDTNMLRRWGDELALTN